VRIDARAILRLPWTTLALGLIAAGFGVACLYVAVSGTRAAELLATPAKAPAALKIDLAPAATSADLAAIQSQPLLHASRVFYVAPSRDAAPATPPKPDYRLAGTLLVPGKPSVALLVNNQSRASRRVKPGETLDGWTVQAVLRQQVTFIWQTERFELSSTAPPVSAGLKRVPITRARVASSGAAGGTGVQSLGAVGNAAPSFSGGPASDQPRLYQPPPN
jgi:hypothetical protein